jgi:hypothetical protein
MARSTKGRLHPKALQAVVLPVAPVPGTKVPSGWVPRPCRRLRIVGCLAGLGVGNKQPRSSTED